MTLTHTHTYVRYFGIDQITPLAEALDELKNDWLERRVHVDSSTRSGGDDRLKMAELAVRRLWDVVPE